MRPYILAETNWKHLKDANMELAVLPWGATEAHNYHLPYGTDVIEADHVAAAAAEIAWSEGRTGHRTAHHPLRGEYRPERYLPRH